MKYSIHTERRFCGLYISQSPHSIRMHSSSPVCACRLPVSLCFQNTCSFIIWTVSFCWLQQKCKHAGRIIQSKCSLQASSAEALVSDSPVSCWTGCWATVSLLALCPILQLLSPLACQALPLQRPEAAEQNLKLPHSSPDKHGASVIQDCLDCSLVLFYSLLPLQTCLPPPFSLCDSVSPSLLLSL